MIVIGIGFKNGAATIKRAVISVLNQKGLKRDIRLLLVNDNSRDSWKNELSEFLGDNRIIIQDVNLGKSYLVRNYINTYIRNNFSETTYIGRLDCDDELVDDTTLSTIENILINDKCDALILGNKLRQNGQVIHRVNIADKRLLDNNFLLNKLQKMSIGDPEGELPSCNTFIKTTVNIDYRPVLSAEDHWFTVDLLLQADKYNIVINEQILYAIYSLSGDLTKNNRQNRNYLTSRKELYHFVKEQYRLSREVIALSLLKKYENKDYQYLGEGFAGIVFHDNSFSYKVHIPKMIGSVEHYRQHCVGTLNEKKHLFQNSKHFFEIKEVVSIKNTYILISKYIPSERVDFFREDELISFLTECWRKKFVFIDIKESNFVRVDNTLKMIDIEIDSYTDNLFLNMIVRAFIRLKYCGCSPDFIFKLGRSAINQFDLPELAGVKAFCNKVFANIIFEESKMQFPEHISQTEDDSIETVEMKFNDSLNLKKIFYDELGNNRYLIDFQIFDIYINKLYFEPKRIRLSFKTINSYLKSINLYKTI